MPLIDLPQPDRPAIAETGIELGAVTASPGPAVAGDDAGFTTAEYAVGTVAACGFAGVLYKLLTSTAITELLGDVIRKAFDFLL
jgi:hypothetical protein